MPIVAAGAIAAAGAIGGAVIGSKASKSAAATQTAAADRAAQLQSDLGNRSLDFQREMWQQGQQNMAPWLSMGSQALGALGQGMGLSGGGGAPRFSPGGGSAMPRTLGGPVSVSSQGQPGGVSGTSGGMTLGSMGQGGYSAPEMVMMRAPNGQTRPVPKAMVNHYATQGAVVVG